MVLELLYGVCAKRVSRTKNGNLIEGLMMISKSLNLYFWFGTCVRYLQDVKGNYQLGPRFDDEKGKYMGVRANLEAFLEILEDVGLRVTQRASVNVKNILSKLGDKPDNYQLSEEEAAEIAEEMYQVRKTLEAELEGMEVYIVTPKRYDLEKLKNKVHELFAPKVYEKLTSIAQFDIREAGMCIVFERSTAGAFHILRATEETLRNFYKSLVKRGRINMDKATWGGIVTDLRKKKASDKHQVLIANLDNIRDSFRNPTQHPDKIYDIQEVQDLWGLCTDAINRMAKVL